MSSKGWYSKEDVIKDIVEVTGKCHDDFGEHYVVGKNPPLAFRTDEDNKDLLSVYREQKPMQSDNIEKPDLVGITEMLRMVDNYNEIPNGPASSTGEHMKLKTKPINIIVSISKMNPNVNEFVPCKVSQISVSDSSIDVESKVSKKELNVNKVSVPTVVENKKTMKTNCCDTYLKNNISDNKINISRLLSNELKEMRDQLKTKICDTSKVNCVKLRRERNLAIATLLKLYCQQPVADENKPNLISPDYFKNNPANKNDITQHNDVKTVSKNYTDDTENNLNDSDAEIINKEIAASVEKVTRWLHNSEPDQVSENDRVIIEPTPNITEIEIPKKNSKKGPSIHLGPITFKRKTNNNYPKSPVSENQYLSDNSQTTNEIQPNSTKSETFVPSVYASELTKKYIQQSKKKQEVQSDIWKSLEAQMKEKDEVIKKQRLQRMT